MLQWDNTTRTAIARELAARVSIRRIETKFDGVQCCACLGPGGCRRGVLGPDLPESRVRLFNDFCCAFMRVSMSVDSASRF